MAVRLWNKDSKTFIIPNLPVVMCARRRPVIFGGTSNVKGERREE
jgi:hypothetical protein